MPEMSMKEVLNKIKNLEQEDKVWDYLYTHIEEQFMSFDSEVPQKNMINDDGSNIPQAIFDMSLEIIIKRRDEIKNELESFMSKTIKVNSDE